MEYSKIIKDLREDNDLKQKDIAEILGTTQSYYAQYENGKRQLPITHLITLAKYYKVSTDYILGLTKDPNPKWTIKNNVTISNNKNVGNITIK